LKRWGFALVALAVVLGCSTSNSAPPDAGSKCFDPATIFDFGQVTCVNCQDIAGCPTLSASDCTTSVSDGGVLGDAGGTCMANGAGCCSQDFSFTCNVGGNMVSGGFPTCCGGYVASLNVPITYNSMSYTCSYVISGSQ